MIAVLAACNNAAASAAPSAAVGGSAAPSAAPASIGASEAPSVGLPSFELPSGAKDLEALLPAQLCGETAIKFSMSGAQFATTAEEEFTKTLSDLGKSANDVSFAAAASSSGDCSAGIFRINGVDQGRLQQVFLDASKSEGSTATQSTVGGKTVYVISSTSGEPGNQYVYFKGDAVLFAQAGTEADAAGIVQALP
jgi:hypothetical protein